VLEFPQIRAMLEILPEPTRPIVTPIVFGSMRVGEVLAFGRKRISHDRISIVEYAIVCKTHPQFTSRRGANEGIR